MAIDIQKVKVDKTPIDGVLAIGLSSNRHFPRYNH